MSRIPQGGLRLLRGSDGNVAVLDLISEYLGDVPSAGAETQAGAPLRPLFL